MSDAPIVQAAYLLAAVLFIFGLKGLTHPRTAVRGNLMGATGMAIAIVAVLFDADIISYREILIGAGAGSLIGVTLAARVPMTAMPELVAIFNGFGGAASALVASSEFLHQLPIIQQTATSVHAPLSVSIGAAAVIGAVTLCGSLIAFAKLAEIVSGDAVRLPAGKVLNLLLVLGCLALIGLLLYSPDPLYFWLLIGAGALLGITLTVPIGGADMPVVIALMNSYSGLAAAAAGFVLQNNALIISGSLVGSSGLILTAIMCKAMNRSLTNVLFGGVGGASTAGPSADEVYGGKVKATSGDEVAMLLETASRVVIVPGYGMAVSQAQHAVRDLMRVLEERGTRVEFGIHPVAGRMPGHMNVLLAESDVPYDHLIEMDDINPTMKEVDVAIVIGANDVVNPVARTDPTSPLAGMPIIDVDKARTVVVIKRSLSPGFAKIPNPLFALDNALMYFGDGKKALIEIMEALKEAS